MLRYNQYKNYNNQQQKTASKSCIFFKINLGYIHSKVKYTLSLE